MLIGIHVCFSVLCAADIVFILKDKPHLRFTREGNDLIFKPEIPLIKVSTINKTFYLSQPIMM